jgi:hypothetical protein
MKICALHYLSSPIIHFQNYFSDVETHIFDSIRNPLTVEMMGDTLPTAEEKQLIYVSSNSSLKTKFPTMSLHKFLISVQIRAKHSATRQATYV